jgi:hypothetical protein
MTETDRESSHEGLGIVKIHTICNIKIGLELPFSPTENLSKLDGASILLVSVPPALPSVPFL